MVLEIARHFLQFLKRNFKKLTVISAVHNFILYKKCKMKMPKAIMAMPKKIDGTTIIVMFLEFLMRLQIEKSNKKSLVIKKSVIKRGKNDKFEIEKKAETTTNLFTLTEDQQRYYTSE